MSLSIAVEPPTAAGIRALLEASDRFHAALYPAESNHLVDPQALVGPGVTLLVARIDGRAGGMAALVARDGYGEIKRMYVADEARGTGLGRALLEAVERRAAAVGLGTLRLETGIRQPAALSLYRAAGYVERGPFGGYAADPLSVFMEKAVPLRNDGDRR